MRTAEIYLREMKTILLILMTLTLASCKRPNPVSKKLSVSDSVINVTKIPETDDQNIDVANDTVRLVGNPTKINGIKCYWKLTKVLNNREEIGESTMELFDSNTQRRLLADKDFYPNFITINDLNSKNAENLKDANFDGKVDYVIYNRTGSGQGGTVYNVYLFNPNKKAYEISEISGGELEIDSVKKTVTTYWHAGIGWRQQTIHQFGNRGKLKYTEVFTTELIEEDSIKETYKKLINGKVVKLNVSRISNN